MKVLKNKTIYTGTGKIENGYIRYSERISEVDDMRNFIPKDEDEIVEVDGAYLSMYTVTEGTALTRWMLPRKRSTRWYVR